MLHMHSRSVNVNRIKLLEILRANLAAHKIEFQTALDAYQARLLADLQLAVKKVKKVQDPKDLEDFSFNISYPRDNSSEYEDVITMFEHSVDENIELDGQSFKAFVENKWPWSDYNRAAMATYAAAGSSVKFKG